MFDVYGTLQTVFQTVLRDTARVFSRIAYRRELLVLSDKGTVGLDWVYSFKGRPCEFSPHAPTVIIMHGVCGDSNAEYLVHLVELLVGRGYRVLVMTARGCGGVPLTTSLPFDGQRTLDFHETVQLVHSRYPKSPLLAMGFSLGAGLLIKYMGDYASITPVKGAIAVSPPWDFQVKPTWAFHCLWTRGISVALKYYILKNYFAFKDIFWKIMLTTWSFYGFDIVMCEEGKYNFDSVENYYDSCSVHTKLKRVTAPTLAISSVDDPLCSIDGCPRDVSDYGPGMIAVIVEQGGHLGFAEHIFPINSSWIDRISLEFFDAIL